MVCHFLLLIRDVTRANGKQHSKPLKGRLAQEGEAYFKPHLEVRLWPYSLKPVAR